MRYLLSAATIALSTGFGAGAADAQSLGAAVRDALDNGCQGFLSPGEFSVTQDVVRIGNEVIDPNYRLFAVEPFTNQNGDPVIDPANPPAIVDPQDGYLVPADWQDDLIPVLDANGSLIRFDLDFDGNLQFERVDGGGTDVLNYLRLETDVTQQVDVSQIRAPNAGVLGAQLAQYCTVNGLAERQTLERTVLSHFFFNDQVGIKTGLAAGGLFGNANALTAFSSSLGAGQGANRSQESVVRRERGLASLIERLRRRAERWREAGIQIASLDDTFTPSSREFAVVLDASGGVVNTDRDVTPLEGGFSADSTIFNVGAAIALQSGFMFGGALTFENTDSDVIASPQGQTNFENESLTTAAFVGWSGPAPVFSEDGSIAITASASYNSGDLSYDRGFGVTYQPDLDSAATITALDQLAGSVDQNVTTISLQATLTQPLGAFTFTPHASISYVQFETGAYAENVTDGTNNGLALRYADVEDEWTEARLGAGLSYGFATGDNSAIEIGVNADAVFVGDAETPLRSAFFVQDLRANPFAITYQVDDLDEQYFDLSGSVSFQFANGFTPYVTAFTRAGHEYIDSQGFFLGARVAF